METRSADGTIIAYHRSGSGAGIVMISGAIRDHSLWDPVTPFLMKCAAILAMDRRGRGASGDRPGSTVGDEIDDVRAVLAEAGPGALLVGHSSGALLALRAAAGIEGLRGVMAYEPPPPPRVSRTTDFARLVTEGDREEALRVFLTDLAGIPASVIADQRATPHWQRGITLAHTLVHDAALIEQGLPGAEAQHVVAPVVLLLGGKSPPSMAANVRAIAGQIPHAQIRTLQGQQHFAMTDDPELFAHQVLL